MSAHAIRLMLLAVWLAGSAGPAAAKPAHDHHQPSKSATPAPITVEPNQAVIEVRGMVCSYCSFGLQKRMGKLPFLDTSKFEQGIHSDIYAQRVTLALKPDQPLDLAKVYAAIKEGGYDAVTAHLRVDGTISRQGTQMILRSASGQSFALSGDQAKALHEGQAVSVQGQVDGRTAASHDPAQPIPMTVTKVEGRQ